MKKILMGLTVLFVFTFFAPTETTEKTILKKNKKGTTVHKNGPLRIYWLDSAYTKTGKIGITPLPGRKDHNRSLHKDILALKQEHVTHVVTLVPKDELEHYGVPDLMEAMEKEGLVTYHLGIKDYGVCSVAQMKQLVQWLKEKNSRENRVVIHCVGGLGRSGLAAAAYLVANGMSAKEAITEVRRIRSPQAVETQSQESFLLQFEKYIFD
jgi:protein-tyrosine phosphatase